LVDACHATHVRLIFGFGLCSSPWSFFLDSATGMSPLPPRAPTSRTALCLWLPTFELRLELVRSPELDTTSVALLAPGEGAGRQVVEQVSERAARAGVRPGMLVSRAVALCPSLTLLEPDPTHYEAAMEGILECLEGVSPVVEPVEPGLIHLGVDGLERLLGPPREEVDRVVHTLFGVLPRPLVAAIRVGRAPGTFAARVAAESARPGAPVLVEASGLARFLASCPLEVLPLSDDKVDRLHRLELRTLGDLGDLPLSALLRQLGGEGRVLRELARGERIDPVRPLHRPRPLRVSLDFPAPVGDREALHRGVDRLLDRLLSRPERRDRALRALRAGGHLEDGGSWQVEVTLREPTARREVLASPLRSRMALRPPSRALETLFVEAFEFGAPTDQASLFDPQEARTGVGGGRTDPMGERRGLLLREALRELRLRLGHDPLYRVVEVDPWSRIPERRHALMTVEP
jgi:protein ImuB